jgi:hypothetical protein
LASLSSVTWTVKLVVTVVIGKRSRTAAEASMWVYTVKPVMLISETGTDRAADKPAAFAAL